VNLVDLLARMPLGARRRLIGLALRRRGRRRRRRAPAPVRLAARALAGPHARRRVVALALVSGALLGGWLWLRDSSLVAASDVSVVGASGPQAPAIRAALRNAARDMTTLHVDRDALRAAVQPFPLVKDVGVETDFPHGLRVTVTEHHPVVALALDGGRVPVAGDGTLLRGQPAPQSLPTLAIPAANAGGRLTSRRSLAAVAIMAAAPASLRPFVAGLDFGPDGLRLSLANGPMVDFGGAERPRAKWAAIAAILADARAIGASYLDVRAPERPVAGRFPDAGGDTSLLPSPAVSTGSTESQSQP
jgi:cell division protein FtsQ